MLNDDCQNDTEHDLYCNELESQYKKAKEDGLFEILKVMELDKEHSDGDLVKSIDYFKERNGVIEKDAPTDFLTEREKRMVYREGTFRPKLYCMLLSKSFAGAIEKKSVFVQHSLKFAFD